PLKKSWESACATLLRSANPYRKNALRMILFIRASRSIFDKIFTTTMTVHPIAFELPRRQRTTARDLFKELDNFRISRQLFDRLFHLVRHERRGFISGKLFVFLVKAGVLKGFGQSFAQNFYLLSWGSWRQEVRRANLPKGAQHRQNL